MSSSSATGGLGRPLDLAVPTPQRRPRDPGRSAAERLAEVPQPLEVSLAHARQARLRAGATVRAEQMVQELLGQ
jgi:hypothetical protein